MHVERTLAVGMPEDDEVRLSGKSWITLRSPISGGQILHDTVACGTDKGTDRHLPVNRLPRVRELPMEGREPAYYDRTRVERKVVYVPAH